MYDIILKNGQIIDGTGNNLYIADIAIKEKKIVKIGKIEEVEGKNIIYAEDKYITPGFIDVHSHGDATIMMFPEAQSSIMQGVTTFIGGLCGDSVAPLSDKYYFRNFWEYDNWYKLDNHMYLPDLMQDAKTAKTLLEKEYPIEFMWKTFDEYLNSLENEKISINFIPLLGHSEIRMVSMNTISDERKPTIEEMKRMINITEEAMNSGAWGFSTGLDYAPSKYAYDEEIIEILKIVKKHGGFYSTHWRTSSMHKDPFNKFKKTDGLIQACEIAKKIGIKTEISHISSVYEIYPAGNNELNKLLARETLKIIDNYINNNVDLVFNIAPNTTYGFKCIPYLIMYFAPWVKQSGGVKQFVENLRYWEYREELKEGLKKGKSVFFNPYVKVCWSDNIVITQSNYKNYVYKTISEISKEFNASPIDIVFKLLMEDPYINVKENVISYAEINEFLKHEKSMVCLDSYIFDNVSTFGLNMEIPEILPNPTAYCGFPIFLLNYKDIKLEDKIKKITGNIANWYGIKDRGFIKEGYYGDINVIDLENMNSNENHVNPMTYPVGIEYVLVNGKIVVEKGKHIGTKSGMVLRHK